MTTDYCDMAEKLLKGMLGMNTNTTRLRSMVHHLRCPLLSHGVGGAALTKNKFFDLLLGVKNTQNVAQYPLYHVTYAPAKFEAFTSNVSGGKAFIRKYII